MKVRPSRHVNNLDMPTQAADTSIMATVRITPTAQEAADRLPVVIRARIYELFRRLERWPAVSGTKPLSGNLAGCCRLRTGDYRIRFRVQGETILVDKIGHRKDFYED
jgi:mRNA-degrading endonuclease RelE of RelBE toxin-antitoxin system